MGVETQSYHFIIVGAGPAGCVLASRLAWALPQQRILLLDAGGPNADPKNQSFVERFATLMTPGYNWGYKTVPQPELDGRTIGYDRGRGLGGSTAINFCVFTRGPRADYDEWAHRVGDDAWSWERVLAVFKKLETFAKPLKDYEGFVDISETAHGFEGPLNVCVPDIWDKELGEYIGAVTNDRYRRNLDHNSGNPIGLAVCQCSGHEDRRSTANGSFLANPPQNLTILTDTCVEKVLFEGKTAIGVEALGRQIYAQREVILSAGAIDSPKLLLLSGIGPSEELASHNVSVIDDLPKIGKNLGDHLWLRFGTTCKPGAVHRSVYMIAPDKLENARMQWARDRQGPLLGMYLPQMIGFLKSDRIFDSEEYRNLDPQVQEYWQAETKPNFEMITPAPVENIEAPETYIGFLVAFMNAQSTGEITLRSADPKDPPLIDPKFLSHALDKRVAIESMREVLEFTDAPYLAEHQDQLVGPKGRSDEEILKYIRASSISMWHMCGTVKMGKPDESETCVDKDFKVLGVEGLRVVDMSVAPLIPCAHTQAVAYMIGEVAAEKMIAEYSASA